MKFIKLNGRHNLYHRGFRYAFRFDNYQDDRHKVEDVVRQTEKLSWGTNTFYGKPRQLGMSRPYYVGFYNEETAMLVKLKGF